MNTNWEFLEQYGDVLKKIQLYIFEYNNGDYTNKKFMENALIFIERQNSKEIRKNLRAITDSNSSKFKKFMNKSSFLVVMPFLFIISIIVYINHFEETQFGLIFIWIMLILSFVSSIAGAIFATKASQARRAFLLDYITKFLKNNNM